MFGFVQKCSNWGTGFSVMIQLWPFIRAHSSVNMCNIKLNSVTVRADWVSWMLGMRRENMSWGSAAEVEIWRGLLIYLINMRVLMCCNSEAVTDNTALLSLFPPGSIAQLKPGRMRRSHPLLSLCKTEMNFGSELAQRCSSSPDDSQTQHP